MGTAVLLRFWRLGEWPPGLYRDEAFNGLDALDVLNGQLAVFFTANNGREPGYIYLTAAAIAFLGRTPLAIRVSAALIGSLTTLFTYLLAKEWFDTRTGLFAGLIWAITLWPIHLSRIGLRPILLPMMLAVTFWLATKAARRPSKWLWLAAGVSYGLSFYTYLAVRFTPLLILLILLYLWRQNQLPSRQSFLWFCGGTVLILLPLIGWTWAHPEQLIGRTNQVSILNPIINQGNLWGTIWRHLGQGLGLFFWRGDTIWRHNPAGRPVFDWVMTIPFGIGVIYSVRHWKRPSHAILLLWSAVMLGPTILAEDTPHFLRAVGILPAVLIFPAIGLNQLWRWERLPQLWRSFAIMVLISGSLYYTLRDYWLYNQNPEVALLFEAAALELAQEIKQESAETAVYVDRWFWDDDQGGWPTLPFIVDLDQATLYRPELGVPPANPGEPTVIYAWQFGSLDFVPTLLQPPAVINVKLGPFARGDLEENAYPLYIRYHSQPSRPVTKVLAAFGDHFRLMELDVTQTDQVINVGVRWEAATAVSGNWVAFVHLVGPDGLITQDDHLPASGLWQPAWWQPDLLIEDSHTLRLPENFDLSQHVIHIGFYESNTAVRLPVFDKEMQPIGDSLIVPLNR